MNSRKRILVAVQAAVAMFVYFVAMVHSVRWRGWDAGDRAVHQSPDSRTYEGVRAQF